MYLLSKRSNLKINSKTFSCSVHSARRFKNLPALNSSLVTISNYDDRFKKPMGKLGQYSKFGFDNVMLFLPNPCYAWSTVVMEWKCATALGKLLFL